MKYKASAFLALAIVLLFLISYFIPAFKSENSENRTLATFDMVLHPEEDSVVYHKEPVERLEAALSDQFPFRETVVKNYLKLNNASENLAYSAAALFKPRHENQYFLRTIGSYASIADTGYLTIFPTSDPIRPDLMDKHCEQLETLHERFPDLDMYVYYITLAYDMPWFNDYLGTNAADHYQELQDALPDYITLDHLVYQDLDDYMDIHYKTDHHWNHKGAYRGYCDIYSLLSKKYDLGDMLVPVSENNASEKYGFTFHGSLAKTLGDLYKGDFDSFSFYEYDYPDMDAAVLDPDTLEEIPIKTLGLYDEYRAGKMKKGAAINHYARLYGTAFDKDGNKYLDAEYPFVLRTDKQANALSEEAASASDHTTSSADQTASSADQAASSASSKNLLILGDSLSKLLREPLASHFDTTVYLDYRVFSKVPVDYLIEHYDIDVLLIASNRDIWIADQYLLNITEDE